MTCAVYARIFFYLHSVVFVLFLFHSHPWFIHTFIIFSLQCHGSADMPLERYSVYCLHFEKTRVSVFQLVADSYLALQNMAELTESSQRVVSLFPHMSEVIGQKPSGETIFSVWLIFFCLENWLFRFGLSRSNLYHLEQ